MYLDVQNLAEIARKSPAAAKKGTDSKKDAGGAESKGASATSSVKMESEGDASEAKELEKEIKSLTKSSKKAEKCNEKHIVKLEKKVLELSHIFKKQSVKMDEQIKNFKMLNGGSGGQRGARLPM